RRCVGPSKCFGRRTVIPAPMCLRLRLVDPAMVHCRADRPILSCKKSAFPSYSRECQRLGGGIVTRTTAERPSPPAVEYKQFWRGFSPQQGLLRFERWETRNNGKEAFQESDEGACARGAPPLRADRRGPPPAKGQVCEVRRDRRPDAAPWCRPQARRPDGPRDGRSAARPGQVQDGRRHHHGRQG